MTPTAVAAAPRAAPGSPHLAARRPKRHVPRRRHGRLLVAVASGSLFILALVALDLWLLLSPSQLEARVYAALGSTFKTPYSIEDVRFSPFSGLSIKGLRVEGPPGSPAPALEVDEATLTIDWRRLTLGEARLVNPRVTLHRPVTGGWSFSQVLSPTLLEREPGAPPPELPTLRVKVERLTITLFDEAPAVSPAMKVHEPGSVKPRRPWRTVHPALLEPPQPIRIGPIDIVAALDPSAGLRARGSIEDPLVKALDFRVDYVPRDSSFFLTVEGKKLKATRDLRDRLLPRRFKRVFDMLSPGGTADFEVHITNRGRPKVEFFGEVKVHNGSCAFEKFPYRARDVVGTIELKGERIILKDLAGKHGNARYSCHGFIHLPSDSPEDRVDLFIEASHIPLDDELGRALPSGAQDAWAKFGLEGTASGRAHVHGVGRPPDMEDDVHWDVDAELEGAKATFQEFPVPVEDLSGMVSVRDERVTFQDIRGRLRNGGEVTVQAAAGPDALTVNVGLAGAVVDDRFRDRLLPKQQKVFDFIGVRGVVDAKVDVSGLRPPPGGDVVEAHERRRIWKSASPFTGEDEMQVDWVVVVAPRPGLEIVPMSFPYVLAVKSGKVVVTNEGARLEGLEMAGSGRFTLGISGEIGGLEEGDPILLALEARSLRIDPAFANALAEDVRKYYDLLDPSSGLIDASLLVARAPRGAGKGDAGVGGDAGAGAGAGTEDAGSAGGTAAPFRKGLGANLGEHVTLSGSIAVTDLAVKPRFFRYPLKVRTARAKFDKDSIEIVTLEGQAGARGRFDGAGRIALDAEAVAEGKSLPSDARVTLYDVEIDRELVNALGGEVENAFQLLNPEGSLGAEVRVEGAGRDLRPRVTARFEDGKLRPRPFPYPITDIRAALSYEDGRFSLDELTGNMGEGWLTAYGDLAGLGAKAPPRGSSLLYLHVDVTGLPLDSRLREALPEKVRRGFANLDPAGRANIQANFFYEPPPPEEGGNGKGGGENENENENENESGNGNGNEGRSAGAGSESGTGTGTGTEKKGGTFTFNAEVDLLEVRLDVGILLKNVDGKVFIHGAVTPGAPPEESPIRCEGGLDIVRATVREQDAHDVTARFRIGSDLFVLEDIRGELFGGRLEGDFYHYLAEPYLYGGDFVLVGGRVERLASKIYAEEGPRTRGRLDGELVLKGEGESPSSLRGQGFVRVTEGHLWELPLVAGVLNILSLTIPDRPVFDHAYVGFDLRGERIVIERAEFRSSALSFYGDGEIVDGDQLLRLTPSLGRRGWIQGTPIIGPLWRGLWGQLIEIEVTGPVDDPQFRPIFMKSIYDPFRKLFGGDEPGARSREILKE